MPQPELDSTRTTAPTPMPPANDGPTAGVSTGVFIPAADGPPHPAFPASGRAGDLGQLGPFRVLARVGCGGMGAVYLAFDPGLRRKAAVKVLLPKYAADPLARDRFLREARAAAAVRSDHVVTIYQVGQEAGIPFIAMEYLDGSPLDEFFRTHGPLTVPQVLRVAREVAGGLAAAHAIGLIHRDIKPANLWLEAPHGRVKILDFGLARGGEAAPGLSSPGTVVGTPAYMSLEQASGSALDARSDLFSLGVVLYRVTTGHLPFGGPNIPAFVAALLDDNPTPVRSHNPDLPEPFAALIHRLLARDPDRRPQSAQDVADAVADIERGVGRGEVSVVDAVPVGSGVSDEVRVPIPVGRHEPSAFADLVAAADAPTAVRAAPPPRFPWAAVSGTLAAVLAVALVFVLTRPAPPPPTPTPTTGKKGDDEVLRKVDYKAERALANWVLQDGGYVYLSGDDTKYGKKAALPNGPFAVRHVSVGDHAPPVTGADLKRFIRVTALTYLELNVTTFTDTELGILARMPFVPDLTTFGLTSDKVTDVGVRALADRCLALELVRLSETKVTDAGLAALVTLPKLRHLAVRSDHVTGKGVAKTNASLAWVSLTGEQLNDDALAAAATHPNLYQLHLERGTGVTDAGLKHLSGLKGLTRLLLRDVPVTDAGLEHLVGLTGLRTLHLQHSPVTDAGVPTLAKMTRLHELNLTGTRVTLQGGAKLRAALPKECGLTFR